MIVDNDVDAAAAADAVMSALAEAESTLVTTSSSDIDELLPALTGAHCCVMMHSDINSIHLIDTAAAAAAETRRGDDDDDIVDDEAVFSIKMFFARL